MPANLKLTGTWQVAVWRYSEEWSHVVETGRHLTVPFTLAISAQGRCRFTDHAGVIGDEQPRGTTHVIGDLDVAEPIYGTGRDNADQSYETLTWLGPFIPWAENGRGRCTEVEIQTWDRCQMFVSARYAQRRQFVYASTIADLDERSQTMLAALLDRLNPDRPAAGAGLAQLALI
jgi:hypothetical protein